jgi:uronate dehydrogenase
MTAETMRTVVLTGAAGRVARSIRPILANSPLKLVLTDRHQPGDLAPHETFVQADLTELAAIEAVLAHADGVIHLGGCSAEAPWEDINNNNIVGTYNIFEAARRQRVERVVFASSAHVVGFYRRDSLIEPCSRPRPDSRYAASKVFGEALGSLFAYKHGVRVLNIRIGFVGERPITLRRLATWIHPEDLVQLMQIGLTNASIVDDVVYGISDCAQAWWKNDRAHELGYQPAHRADDHYMHALATNGLGLADPVYDRYQGGGACQAEFGGGFAAMDPAVSE